MTQHLKYLFLFSVIFIFHFSLPAQNSEIDSLKNELKSAKEDTNKIKILNSLSSFYLYYLPPEAGKYAGQALALSEKLNYTNGIAESYLNLGYVCYRKDDYYKQIEYVKKALLLFEQTRNKIGIGRCYNHLAEAYYALGDFVLAMDYCLKAMSVFESVNYKQGIGKAYYNLGTFNNEFDNNLDSAFARLQKALSIQSEINNTREIGLILSFLGDIYEKKTMNKEALDTYMKSLYYSRQSFNRNAESYTLNSLGNYYFNHSDYEKSFDFFSRSLKINEETENYYGVIRNRSGMSKNYLEKKDYKNAMLYNTKSFELAKQIGDKYGTLYAYNQYVNIYDALNDSPNALKYQKLYSAMKDSVYNLEASVKLMAMQSRFVFDKKILEQEKENEKQKAIAEEKNRQQKITIWSVAAGLLLVMTFAIFILRSYRQKQKANKELAEKNILIEQQKKIVEEKNKDITDSINYAKRIQEAILSPKEIKYRIFPDAFVLFQPKDVVSGDFYWFAEKNGKRLISAVDCTGHGVPGAFMSMVGNAFLNEIVNERGITQPDLILSELRHLVIKALKQKDELGGQKDGMDISLLSFSETHVEWAGAHNPLLLIRIGKIIEYEADKRPIGFHMGKGLPFTNHKIELQKGDALYIFTDGYADQFGGPKGKKFKYKQFQQMLLSIQNEKMMKQEEILLDTFSKWKGNLEQIDDVLVIGIKV